MTTLKKKNGIIPSPVFYNLLSSLDCLSSPLPGLLANKSSFH